LGEKQGWPGQIEMVMKTKEMTQEQISAFADGELADQQVDVVLAALRRPDGRADWEVYHQIGDVLRSDDMDVKLSSGFAARMAARLEMEPTIIAPAIADNSPSVVMPDRVAAAASARAKRPIKRWAMPGMVAAAAVATAAFIATPQLMVAMKSESTGPGAPVMTASVGRVPSSNMPSSASTGAQAAVVSASAPEGVVLRDARMNDYLLAHQRFSPSVYSTAQYARSATFATDSDK
jgi:sigma-E factor negative regulatory protein RseA